MSRQRQSKVALYASDGYSSDLSIDLAKQDNVILAYAKDGSLLSGLRLVVPGHWGYKWINQVQSIKLVNYNFLGRWESQGYSDDGLFTPSNPLGPTLSQRTFPNCIPFTHYTCDTIYFAYTVTSNIFSIDCKLNSWIFTASEKRAKHRYE